MRNATLASIFALSGISLPLLSTAALAANSASFVKTDTVTMGNWMGAYGADGYNVSQDGNVKNPSYAKVVLSGQYNWTWKASTNGLPALQRPENPSARIAGTWFSYGNVTDGNSHQVALYALDWDSSVRAETIRVLDVSTGAVLDSRSLSAGSFHNGTYLVWNVRGHVKFEVTKNAGANAVISGLFFGGVPPVRGGVSSPLTVSANPNYFKDATGKTILLAGSHTWNIFMDRGTNNSPQPIDFTAFVNFLVAHGHNYTFMWETELPNENWTTDNVTMTSSPFPWIRTSPGYATDGKLKFDLTKLNQTYFDRMRARVSQLNQAGIYVGLYLFNGQRLAQLRTSTDGYPFTGANNINDVDAGTGGGGETMQAPNAITNYQDAFVRKVVDTLNDMPNVIWIVQQEALAESLWWSEHIMSVVRTYEATKPFKHPIGIGPYQPHLSDTTLYNGNADFVQPWAFIMGTTSCGSGTPACKVTMNDSDHSYPSIANDSNQLKRNWAWKNFMNGNSVAFMDPYVTQILSNNRNNPVGPITNHIGAGPDPKFDNIRDNLGYILRYSRRIDMSKVTPRKSEICSTSWCLAQTSATGAMYLVYAPNSGSFNVNLTAMEASRSLNVEWFNPATGASTSAGTVAAGATRYFTPPFSGDAVLLLMDSAL